jgi:hypothetical protein
MCLTASTYTRQPYVPVVARPAGSTHYCQLRLFGGCLRAARHAPGKTRVSGRVQYESGLSPTHMQRTGQQQAAGHLSRCHRQRVVCGARMNGLGRQFKCRHAGLCDGWSSRHTSRLERRQSLRSACLGVTQREIDINGKASMLSGPGLLLCRSETYSMSFVCAIFGLGLRSSCLEAGPPGSLTPPSPAACPPGAQHPAQHADEQK